MIEAAYNWAIDEELLAANPAQRVKNPPALRPLEAAQRMEGEAPQLDNVIQLGSRRR